MGQNCKKIRVFLSIRGQIKEIHSQRPTCRKHQTIGD
jgi:hypothetical protein